MSWPPDALAELAAWGVALTDEQQERLERYAALIAERGRRLNLVSSGDYERLYDRHLFDSLTAVPLVEWSGKRVFDVGSGAGLPGIPLAIACPEARLTLVERTRKRAAFLVHAIYMLGLANADAQWADVRDLARQDAFAHAADIITVRALAGTSDALELVRGALRAKGCVLLWQTADQWEREPTLEGYHAGWHPTPSRDGVRRGIRVCRPMLLQF